MKIIFLLLAAGLVASQNNTPDSGSNNADTAISTGSNDTASALDIGSNNRLAAVDVGLTFVAPAAEAGPKDAAPSAVNVVTTQLKETAQGTFQQQNRYPPLVELKNNNRYPYGRFEDQSGSSDERSKDRNRQPQGRSEDNRRYPQPKRSEIPNYKPSRGRSRNDD